MDLSLESSETVIHGVRKRKERRMSKVRMKVVFLTHENFLEDEKTKEEGVSKRVPFLCKAKVTKNLIMFLMNMLIT